MLHFSDLKAEEPGAKSTTHRRITFCNVYFEIGSNMVNGGGNMKISELQAKDVVNIADGRKLGQIYDLELDLRQGTIRALVVPSESKWFGFVSSGQEWVIPWRQIVKIGSDVILVRLDGRERDPYYAQLPAGKLSDGD